ncbi:class I SAM-dependent methyltransferase [Actinoplanes sp. GCM10030250]|uniref:class I SAM-dependent methyltransferase n=1 Tax=Actinoplanes sp. GCM10030250 TaxID=3273376 RepID=UPI00361D43CE
MPTLPSEPHQQRRMAESFGVDPGRYDRTRPPYPQALVDRIVAAAPGRDVADAGCGTGTAARQFRAAGCRVLGIEPDARMAGWARDDGLEVDVSAFEDWDPAGRRFDAVVAGTSWHWIDPVAGAAKAAGVLRPGGLLAAFWHVPQPPAEVTAGLGESLRRVMPDLPFDLSRTPGPDGHQPLLARAEDGIREAGFGEPERWRFDWERRYSRDEWLDQLPTSGVLTRLAPEPLAEVLHAVGAAADSLGGTFVVRYSTMAVVAVVAVR